MSRQQLLRATTNAAQTLRSMMQSRAFAAASSLQERIDGTGLVFAGFRIPHNGLMNVLGDASKRFHDVVMIYPQVEVGGYSPFSDEQRRFMLEIAAKNQKVNNLNIASIPVEVWHQLQEKQSCQYALNWITEFLENDGFGETTIVRGSNKGSREHPLYASAELLTKKPIYVLGKIATFQNSSTEAKSGAEREVDSSQVLRDLFSNDNVRRDIARSALPKGVFDFIQIIAQIAYLADQDRTDPLSLKVGEITAEHYKTHWKQAQKDLRELEEKGMEVAICHNGQPHHLPLQRHPGSPGDKSMTLLQAASFGEHSILGHGYIEGTSPCQIYEIDDFGNKKLLPAQDLITLTPIGPAASRHRQPKPIEKIGVVVNKFPTTDSCQKMIGSMLKENDVVVIAIDENCKDASQIKSLFAKEIDKGKIKMIDLGEKVSATNLKEALQQNFAAIAPENIKFYSYAAKDRNAIAANMVESGFSVSVSRPDRAATLSQNPALSATVPKAMGLAMAIQQNVK